MTINQSLYDLQSELPKLITQLSQLPKPKCTESMNLKRIVDYSLLLKPCSPLAIKSKLNASFPEDQWTGLQKELGNYIQNHQDILYTMQSLESMPDIRQVYLFYALNHILKSNDLIQKNSEKIKSQIALGTSPLEYKDQGFTKPKVLILLPFKNSCLELLEILFKLLPGFQIDNKKRFYDEYQDLENHMDDSKPLDYKSIFSGNNDDHFRLGIKLTRNQIKLFSNFYSSDLLIASPLGLRTIIGAPGDKKRDFDFLSSLEMVIMDQSDIFLMQNWEHLQIILDSLNALPKESHNTDFSRVRPFYLDEQAKYFCQKLVFSQLNCPELNHVFNSYFTNICGKVKMTMPYSGILSKTLVQIPQIFSRFTTSSPVQEPTDRFEYFTKKILPQLQQSALLNASTLIFIPSYFDFVKLKNYFKTLEISFTKLCEYTENADISRARHSFFHSKVNFLLYTERFHFFKRYNIRGIKNIVFYGLPLYDAFYSELLYMIQDTSESCVMAMYCKYDKMKLERITGSKNAEKMMSDDKDSFLYS